MPAVILDACGTLNLYASGQFVPILSVLQYDWHIPLAVEREALHCRQPDPNDPEKLIKVSINLVPALISGILKPCNCENDEETALYVELAAKIGDDGESMGLAIAKCRGWTVMTDDKKARRIAGELGIEVIGTPQVMKKWAEIAVPQPSELAQILGSIQQYSNYRPTRNAVDFDWWVASLQPDMDE